LEEKCKEPGFWEDKEKAAEISQKLSNLKEKVQEWREIDKHLKDVEELVEITEAEEMEEEMKRQVENLKSKIEDKEIEVFLSDKYDDRGAVLSIYSGAGGQDAEDWAAMLLRMYKRYCKKKEFKTKILSQSFGEPGPEGRVGVKKASMEIKGDYAYGLLKHEHGVHRLVRISPFSAQDLRHTSFARVEVLPVLPETAKDELEIKPDDLKIDTFRASGPGGQYVNRRESAVRITHLPTNTSVSCQSERLQGKNKEKAMEQLYSKIYQLMEEQRKEKISDLKGKKKDPEFGNQIRSYVLHPYKLVKDTRTNIEASNINSVLDGNLDQFINAEVKKL